MDEWMNNETPQETFATEPILSSEEPKPRKKSRLPGLIALALCFSLLGSVLGAGGVLLAHNYLIPQESTGSTEPTDGEKEEDSNLSGILQGNRENTVIEIVDVETGKLMTPAEVYAANVNSTVGITTSITTNFWGQTTTSAASGSGFIISQDGYILTNHHVIEDATTITVSMYSGESYSAKLIGYDENNDLAVLKIDAKGLSPVILGDSDNLNVGDSVLAIGNPLGELTFSLTAGAISAKGREITMSNGITMNLLQTDCAINSGNSGGALFNLYGEVIGITNAKFSGSSNGSASIDNIGFAIPMNSIRSIVESIIEKGYISKPFLGVTVSDVSPEYQMFGLPLGAAVQEVSKDSPAEDAGVQVGDIITAINGTTITGRLGVKSAVTGAKAGDRMVLTVYRKGQTVELTVIVGEQIQSALGNSQTDSPKG